MSTEKGFEVAARRSAEEGYRGPRMHVGTVVDREMAAHVNGWYAAREYLLATPTMERDPMDAQRLAGIARTLGTAKGYTVELDLDGDLYTGEHFDEVIYNTPAHDGIRWTFGVHETDGLVRVFVHPEDVERAEAALSALRNAEEER